MNPYNSGEIMLSDKKNTNRPRSAISRNSSLSKYNSQSQLNKIDEEPLIYKGCIDMTHINKQKSVESFD